VTPSRRMDDRHPYRRSSAEHAVARVGTAADENTSAVGGQGSDIGVGGLRLWTAG